MAPRLEVDFHENGFESDCSDFTILSPPETAQGSELGELRDHSQMTCNQIIVSIIIQTIKPP